MKQCIKTIEEVIDFLEQHAKDLFNRDQIYERMEKGSSSIKDNSYDLQDIKNTLIFIHDTIETESIDTTKEMNKFYDLIEKVKELIH